MDDSSQEGQYRRRIDRITADDYLEGIDALDTVALRAMRDDCREEESRFSYNRRLLQGRIDILTAELARRGGDSTESLIESLPRILADDPGPRAGVGDARNMPLYEPGDEAGRRSDDRLAADALLTRLPDLTDSELAAELDELRDEERRVSELRRAVLERLDALQAELIRRYRDGGVDDIVSALPDTGQ